MRLIFFAAGLLFLNGTAALADDIAPLSTFQDCADCPQMVAIPPGSFMMGGTKAERKIQFVGLDPYDHPQHKVDIAYPFAIGQFEVTVDEFDAYVKETGATVGGTCAIRLMEKGKFARKFNGTKLPNSAKFEQGPYLIYISDGSYAQPGLPVTGKQPAVCVSRTEMQGYLDWLSEKSGRRYRLPTEAEWEYAARAGTEAAAFWGDDMKKACTYANFGDRKSGYQAGMMAPCAEKIHPDWTAEVGSYEPNAWKLYDMSGNVQEMIADCWHDTYDGAPADGSPWTEADCALFVARGGDYELPFMSMRVAERLWSGYVEEEPDPWGKDSGKDSRSNMLGFRVAVFLDGSAWDAE